MIRWIGSKTIGGSHDTEGCEKYYRVFGCRIRHGGHFHWAGARRANRRSDPDFTRFWRHQCLPGLEPLASGPTSLTNRSRRNGVSDYNQLVGDYTNPILKPQAADVVKKFGELSLAGVTYPSPANQCWP